MSTALRTRFQAEIPAWVVAEVSAAGEVLGGLEERMALANRLAKG